MRASPVVVSFYSGEERYRVAAERLRDDCVGLGLDHDIVDLEARPEQTWLDLCRRKVGFFLEMQRKHCRPILWLDADSRLLRRPTVLDGLACDIAGFLRGTRYLRDFDPLAAPRFFAPFALYFNYTRATTGLLELMHRLEQGYTEEASDDFFLQEAWMRHTDQLSVLVLPPNLVTYEWPARGDETIYVGISGNVSTYKPRAKQHLSAVLAPERRKAVLLHEAAALQRSGQLGDALVLYRRALAVGGNDEALAGKIARLIQRQRNSAEAERFVQEYRGSAASSETDQ